jgi:hypothetical protein
MRVKKRCFSFSTCAVLLIAQALAPYATAQNNMTTQPKQIPNNEEKTMTQSTSPTSQIPPDVLRYLKGASSNSRQYEFFIGDWDVAAIKYDGEGSVLFQYKAKWSAKYLNEGRMVIDDFKAYSPAGQEVSSFVTDSCQASCRIFS